MSEEGEIWDEWIAHQVADCKRRREEHAADVTVDARPMAKRMAVLLACLSRIDLVQHAVSHVRQFAPSEWGAVFSRAWKITAGSESDLSRGWETLLRELEEQLVTVRSWDAWNLACVIYGCHKLGLSPSIELMRRWQHVARACLGDFTPQGLSTSLRALAHLGANVEQDFLNEWKDVAIAKLATFSAISLAMSMQGLAKLPCAFSLEDGFGICWKECVRSRFGEFFPLETVLCVCALAKRGLKQEVAADPLFIEWMHVTSLEQFKPQDLAIALWALATLEARPKDYGHFIGNWFARARLLLPAFNPVDLVNTIWACSKLELREEDFLRRWVHAARSWINCFSGPELAVTIKSLELLEVDPYSDLVAEWLRCAARFMPQLDARDLSSIVPALGAMRCRDVQFLNAMQLRLIQLAPTLTRAMRPPSFTASHCCTVATRAAGR
jgi:hypothetical protein